MSGTLIRGGGVLLLIGVALCAGVRCRRGPDDRVDRADPAPTGPNVVLISIDTLRPDHLGCYGYQRNTSPRIDRLANEGVLFENCISSTSWTLPAHVALFTSLADSVHGCTDTNRRLHGKIVTWAERFAAAGYRTAGFFSGPYLHPAFGLAQGFDHYENCTSYARTIDRAPPAKWAENNAVMRDAHQDVTNPTVYRAVRRWLEAHPNRPFFMFIHMWDVHFDFLPPDPYDKMFDPKYQGPVTGADVYFDPRIKADMPKRDLEHLIALYDGEIAWTDHHVGKIVDDLSAANLLDETVLAITADHGTEFFEHGDKTHRKTLFDEVVRIPLVLRYPGGLPAGVRVKAQARIIDIGPTLAALAGLGAAPEVMGHSLVPLALGQQPAFDNAAVSELFSLGRRMRTLRTPEWKLTDRMVLARREYVDLTADPGERHPLTNLGRGMGLEALVRYEAVVKDLEARRARMPDSADPAAIPEAVRQQLESLGYIGR